VYTDWEGEVAVTEDNFTDVSDPTLGNTNQLEAVEFLEEEVREVVVTYPSEGERNYAPLAQGRWPVPPGLESVQIRPADEFAGGRGIFTGDPDRPGQAGVEWAIQPRSRVKFITDMRGLRLELGDCFRLTWGRGLQPKLLDRTVFYCEALRFLPDTLAVEVTGIWRADADTAPRYILDDETLQVRALTGSVTVTPGSPTVTFSGLSATLATAGVSPGDILVLRDASLGEEDFRRFRCLRVVSSDGINTITVADSLDFGPAGPYTFTQWQIRAGALSTPPALATNYPRGWQLFGKMSDLAVNGTFSDGATKAHQTVTD
jgi:hypothetical protein